MFYDQRVVDIPDGKPKWTGINDKSELIEDSPPHLKRKRDNELKEAEQEGAHVDSEKKK